MGRFWDARARENAPFFVDNRLDYTDADLDVFWRRGREELDELLDAVAAALAPDDVAVDIGCGIGRLTRVLASRAASVYALDVSAEMLDRAKQHNANLANITWVKGDGTSLAGIDDGAATACISHVVFQHIPDPSITMAYIRDIGRVLKPGGWAAFQVSNDPSIHRRRWDRDQWRVRIGSLVGRAPRRQQHAAWRGSAVELGDVGRAAADGGMDVERVANEGQQLCYVLARKRTA